jgi:hypothetical protein
MSLLFTDQICQLNLKTESASYDLSFASGGWHLGETTMHGPNIFSRATGNLEGLAPFKIAGAYTWKDDKSLELTLRYIDCMHTERFSFIFTDDNKVLVDIKDSISARNAPPAIEGVIE